MIYHERLSKMSNNEYTRTRVQVDEAKLAELLKKHRQAVYEWAEGDGCLCGVTLQGDGGLKPGPEEVAEHISSVVAEWLRGGGR